MNRTDESLKTFIGIKRTVDYLDKIIKTDINSHGLNVTEFAVLELLYNKGPQPIQKIKNRVLIASSSMTYVIDQLVKKGWIIKEQDKQDKRSTIAKLSDKGVQLMNEIFPQHAKTIETAFSELNDEELTNFRNILKKISAITD